MAGINFWKAAYPPKPEEGFVRHKRFQLTAFSRQFQPMVCAYKSSFENLVKVAFNLVAPTSFAYVLVLQ